MTRRVSRKLSGDDGENLKFWAPKSKKRPCGKVAPLRKSFQAAVFGCFFSLGLAGADAQVQFYAASLPNQPGQSYSCFYSTNVNVSGYLTLNTNLVPPSPNSPGTTPQQFWGFAQPQTSNETVWRTDIVTPDSGRDNEYYSAATYAEQNTIEPSSVIGWNYYATNTDETNGGRVYLGFDVLVPGATSAAIFGAPTVDIPASVELGQTWSRSVSWGTIYYGTIFVSNYCAVSAIADATGLIALPSIGTVPALRVHEVHSYTATDPGDSSPVIDVHTNDCYYWLVPGLGIAAQVTLYGSNVISGQAPLLSSSVLRMFSDNYFTNTNSPPPGPGLPPMATNLQITLQSNAVLLNWNTFTNGTNYEIDFTPSLLTTGWQYLGATMGTTWTDSVAYPAGFYRVIAKQ